MLLTMKCFLFTLLLLSCINNTINTESNNNSPVTINNSPVIIYYSPVNISNPPHSEGNEILKIIEIAAGILIAVIGLFTAYHLSCRRKLIRSLCLDGQNDGDGDGDDDDQSGVELQRPLNAPPAQQSMDRVGSSSGNREESNTVGNGGDIENGIRNAMLLKWLLSFPRLAGGFYFHINKVNPYSASVSDDDKKKKMGKKSNKRHKPKTSDDEDGDDKKKEEGKKRSDIDGNSGSMNDNENIVRNEMGLERMLRPKEDDVKQKSVPASNLPEEYRNDGSSDDDDGSQRIRKRSKKKWYSSEEDDDSDSYSDNGTDDDTRKGKESKKRHKSKKSRGRGKSKRRVYSSDESDDDDDDKKKKKGKERLDKSDIDGNSGSMNDNEEDVKTKSVPASSLPEEPPADEIKKVNPYSDSVSDDDTREGKESKKRHEPKKSDDEDDDKNKKGKKRSDKSDIDAKEETGFESPAEEDDDMGLINDKKSVFIDEVRLGYISDIIPTNVELDVWLICDSGFNLAEKEVADGCDSDSDTEETDFERFEFAGSSDVGESKRRCLMTMIDQRDFDVEKFPENFEMKDDIRDVARNQVLRFLPAKALARSRLVSKKWNEWIGNPFFSHMQCQYHKITSGFFQDDNTIIRFISLNHNAYGVPHPSLSFIPRNIVIKASCNGLLLCQTSTDDSEFLVCNPANKQYFWLPPSSSYHGPTPKIVLAFEPSSLNFEPCYQVICPFSLPDPSQGPIVYFDIFDSRTRSWRISETSCVGLHESDVRSNGIFVDGVAYWETTGGELLSFDLKNEIYGVQSVPYGEGGALSKVNGELCYVKANYHHETRYCFVDVFSGGAMTLKGSLGFDVDCIEDGMDANCVVVGNPCDDMIAVVVQSRGANILYAYSLKEKKMAIGPCYLQGSVKLFPYVNSLIPIDTGMLLRETS